MLSRDVLSAEKSEVSYSETDIFSSVLHRMLHGTGTRTQTELAEILKIGKAAISDAKRRKIIPAEWFLKLSRAPFFLNPNWIETGTGLMHLPGVDVADGSYEYGMGELREFFSPPQAKAKPGENGQELDVASKTSSYAFKLAWLKNVGQLGQMKFLRFTGDSMLPTLLNNDMLLIDESQRDVLEGKIYALRMDQDIVVKRVAKKPGKLVLISDNRELYEPLEIDVILQDNVQIIGRVVWVGREDI